MPSIALATEGNHAKKTGKAQQICFTPTLSASKSFFTPASYQCEVKCNEKKQYRTISADIDPWFFGNFILGGIIGMAIDGASGAAYKLEDAYYIHFSEFDN